MSGRFDPFISSLARFEGHEDLSNPWSYDRSSNPNRIRRANLRHYFSSLDQIGTDVMFVGEALGHRGGRLSGVPFTSLSHLLEGDHDILGTSAGYRDPGDGGSIRREASATMVWEAIDRLPRPPVLWNAFPFHPHRPGEPRSNRPPRSAELELGAGYLERLAGIFRIERFVAVGRTAARTLDRLGIVHRYVRHPSLGGKQQFRNGLTEIFGPRGTNSRATRQPPSDMLS